MYSSLQPRGLGWRNKFLIFLSGLQKLEQSAKKFTVLRGENVEKNREFFAVDFLIPGRVADLPAPPIY